MYLFVIDILAEISCFVNRLLVIFSAVFMGSSSSFHKTAKQ
jgi:hypothetical protein